MSKLRMKQIKAEFLKIGISEMPEEVYIKRPMTIDVFVWRTMCLETWKGNQENEIVTNHFEAILEKLKDTEIKGGVS